MISGRSPRRQKKEGEREGKRHFLATYNYNPVAHNFVESTGSPWEGGKKKRGGSLRVPSFTILIVSLSFFFQNRGCRDSSKQAGGWRGVKGGGKGEGGGGKKEKKRFFISPS